MKKTLIALVTVLQLIPHPFGVSPIGAMALYAGAYGPKRTSWAMPLLPLFVAGLVFGFYDPVVMAFVFAGFALSTLAGRWLLSREKNLVRIGGAVAAGAVIFFVVSNFSIWLVGMYPPTAAGLLQCYANGLPYLAQAMLADAAYCFVLFGLHNAISRSESMAEIVRA